MKKFQILFATILLAVITLSFTSCSDDATSTTTPVSAFTKSTTQPDSYMPYNSSNTATYELNLNGTKETKLCTFTSQPNYMYQLNSAVHILTPWSKTNSTYYPFTGLYFAQAYNNLYCFISSTTANGTIDINETATWTYDVSDNTIWFDNTNSSIRYTNTYETISISGTSFNALVVNRIETDNNQINSKMYFAKGYGLIKVVFYNNEMTMKSCSLK